jgi:hypothetical protein
MSPWRGLSRALFEVISILREAVLLPVRVLAWLASRARDAGTWALERLRSPVGRALLFSREAIRLAERAVTPARAAGTVALCAAALLVASQFTDYRAVRVGTPEYRALGAEEQAPRVAVEDPRDAHGALLLVLGAAAGGFAVAALGGRWRLARLVALAGAVVVAVTLFVDMPEGLREGAAAEDYEGAEAILLDGFWAQLAAGASLALAGLVLGPYLRAEGAPPWLVGGRAPRGLASAGRAGS